MKKLLLTITLFFISTTAHADLIFEGYYKIIKENIHIGYTILRFEYNPAKQEMIATSFIKTAPKFTDLTESYVARANTGYQPISLQFTSVDNTKRKTAITAKMVGENFVGELVTNGPPQKLNVKIKKGVFFSSFLPFLMLKAGLKTGLGFTYYSITEESAEVKEGTANIGKTMEDFKGQKVFRVSNKFMGVEYSSFIAPNGEILYVDSPTQQTSTELTSKEIATQGMPVPQSIISALFGGTPAGTKNSLGVSTLNPTKSPSPPATTGGKATFPAGQGIIVKPTKPPPQTE
ncbi:MAG: hypothetical protein SGJ18_06340 [Pseudomonadota bacterium]|nr:hypothetical protein [Pseudomonadota bacterium]